MLSTSGEGAGTKQGSFARERPGVKIRLRLRLGQPLQNHALLVRQDQVTLGELCPHYHVVGGLRHQPLEGGAVEGCGLDPGESDAVPVAVGEGEGSPSNHRGVAGWGW